MGPASERASIQNQLWLCFTYYGVKGNAQDPERLTEAALVSLCRDAQVVGAARGPSINAQDVHVACAQLRRASVDRARQGQLRKFSGDGDARGEDAVLASRSRGATGGAVLSHSEGAWRGLTFREFLDALALLAQRLFPGRREEAYGRLLAERVLPLAGRRAPPDVSKQLKDANVLRVRDALGDELFGVFSYYAARSQARAEKLDAQAAPRWSEFSGSSFAATRTLRGGSHARARYEALARGGARAALAWDDFRRFAADFGLGASGGLSNQQVADCYLACVVLDTREHDDQKTAGWRQRRLYFEGFWEVLVRCALMASRPGPSASDRVKALLLFLYRNRQHASARNLAKHEGGAATNRYLRSDLVVRADRFCKRLKQIWEADGFAAYCEPPRPPPPAREHADDLLSTLLNATRPPAPRDEADDGPLALIDDAPLADGRFTVESLEALFRARPLVGTMLLATLEASE